MMPNEWAAEALSRAVEEVEEAMKGGRHDALKRRSVAIAPYVRDGHLSADQVTTRLVQAAQATGKNPGEARAVIEWGLEHGRDGEAWYPDPDDRSTATIQWGGKTLTMPRKARSERPKLILVGEDEPTPFAPRLRDCDLSGVQLLTAPVAAPEDCPLPVTLYPAMKGGIQGARHDWTWAQLVRELADPELDVKDKRRDVPMWAPHLVEGDARPKGAVPDRHTALILDYDGDEDWTVETCSGWWADVRHVVHTSWSHNIEKERPSGNLPAMGRGRVVVALSRPITPDELSTLAEWVLQSGRGHPGEEEIRSVIRAYVAPCMAPGGYQHASHDPGAALDVDGMLRAIEQARQGLITDLEEHAPDPDVWGMLDVRMNKHGEVVAVANHHRNLVAVLRHDRRQVGRWAYDEFAETGLVDGAEQTDIDILKTMEWLGQVYDIHATKDRTHDAIRQVSHEHSSHQVRDYLEGLEWDGKVRVQDLLWKYMGCQNDANGTSLIYARRWMVSAVARALQPGCKVDTMLILKGAQGARKSSGFRALAGEDWFGDSPISIGTDDAAQALQGVWIQEVPELDSMRRKEVTAIKAFVAAQEDRFRRRYDRMWTTRPRQTVLVGTTNEDSFLADATGSRRFWVREVVKKVDIDLIRQDRDQLWAEAVHLFREGEQWWLTQAEDAARSVDNEAYEMQEPWEEDLLLKAEARPHAFQAEELLADVMDCKVGDLRKGHVMAATRILAREGYQKSRRMVGGVRATRWQK